MGPSIALIVNRRADVMNIDSIIMGSRFLRVFRIGLRCLFFGCS